MTDWFTQKEQEFLENEENVPSNKLDLFRDMVSSINEKTPNLFHSPDKKDLAKKSYVPYIVNKNFSQNQETVLYANELNRFSSVLTECMNYDFYYHALPKRKRYFKWAKKGNDNDVDEETFKKIKNYFGYSDRKVKQLLSVLNKQQIKQIKSDMDEGGKA